MQPFSIKIFTALLLIVGVVFLLFLNPETTGYLPCIFKKITGLQCPGCGSARASYHLLHGNLFTAIDYNILLVFFSPYIFCKAICWFGAIGEGSALHSFGASLKSHHVLIVVVVFLDHPEYPILTIPEAK